MKISNIKIENFRLLKEVELNLSDVLTVIVGRNNSGKTSLTEIFKRLLSEKPFFRAEDFSLESLEGFWTAFQKFKSKESYTEYLPSINVEIMVNYGEDELLGALSPFVIDLDPDCTNVIISIRFQANTGLAERLFEEIDSDIQEAEFYQGLNKFIRTHYQVYLYTIDATDQENSKEIEFSQLRIFLQCGFINAQRGLNDDTLSEKRGVLASILEKLFINTEGSEDLDEKSIVENIEKSIENVQETLDGAFREELDKLFPTFELFGYPGLADPNLITKTTLDAKRLLSGHTAVHYTGINGINLPENYNGLGSRNLIYILLQLYDYFKVYKNSPIEPGTHLIFIEEPEAHLHPQMQEVFTEQLKAIVKTFSDEYNEGKVWPVQFIITTHSSHIANKASFKDIRYFLPTLVENGSKIRQAKIKDLKVLADDLEPANEDFLHKYLTLTNCDLFFADKVILIEGTAERLFLPSMIKKVETKNTFERNLSSQYTTILEVGGAYSQLFFPILDFLEIPSLIITDIDSVKKGEKRREKSYVCEGEFTSNSSIKKWSDLIDEERKSEITIPELLELTEAEKVLGKKRIAFQIAENDKTCVGRSLEEAFILANLEKFSLVEKEDVNLEEDVTNIATSYKKSDFALQFTIEDEDWQVPKYIEEGIMWLTNQNVSLLADVIKVESNE